MVVSLEALPLAPMVLLLPLEPVPAVVPLPIVPLPAVLPLPVAPLPVVPLLAVPLPDVLPVPLAVLPDEVPEPVVPELEPEVVVLGEVVPALPPLVLGPVDEPAGPVLPVPAVAPVALLPDPLPALWAIAYPPNANAAAAARVVRVFLLVVMCCSLNGKPRRDRLIQPTQGQLFHSLRSHSSKK